MFDCNTFKDKRHFLLLVAIILPFKELQSATLLCRLSVTLLEIKDIYPF